MDYAELSKFKFWKKLDETITRQSYSGERHVSLYPSEASCVRIDPDTHQASIMGGCARKSWYRLLGFEPSNPTTVKSEYIFEMGRAIEKMITELAKLSGIYDNNSVKFWDKSSGVSGEIDVVVKHMVGKERKYIFIEAKSTYGGLIKNGYETGKARSLFDHFEGRGKEKHMVKGKPKPEHVLQLAVYLYTHKDDPDLLGGKLVYFLRDNANKNEFDLVLVDEDGRTRVSVDGEIDKGFFMEDVYERYALLASKVNEDVKMLRAGCTRDDLRPPMQDYTLEYDKETINKMYDLKQISKTAYDAWINGKSTPGSWQCMWCSNKDRCWEIKPRKKEVLFDAIETEEEEEITV